MHTFVDAFTKIIIVYVYVLYKVQVYTSVAKNEILKIIFYVYIIYENSSTTNVYVKKKLEKRDMDIIWYSTSNLNSNQSMHW